MDISITRVPQDGRFTMMVDRREINVRVSTLPTIYGENVVMRLLDMSTNHVYTLDKLGMSDKDCKTISQTIERPYGMILSTGPTGSAKISPPPPGGARTKSLYSILQLLNKPDVNAITLEDPVEYRIDGIRQVQLNVRAGMTFASGLRSILRQDPDVIMVGEIRDSETAQIAVQAVKAWLDSRAAGEPGGDMHVIFDVYTEQDENFYRAILGEDEKPANDAEE